MKFQAKLIIIDEERIFKEIEEKDPASVSLNGPDGILPQVQETAIKISIAYHRAKVTQKDLDL